MQEDTLFRLASVTKPIVSAAAMALVARHKLSLDDDVTKWLPEFRPALRDGSVPVIKVRHLLTHSAGLGYRYAEADAAGPYARAGVSDEPMAHRSRSPRTCAGSRSVPLQYAPGTGWNFRSPSTWSAR